VLDNENILTNTEELAMTVASCSALSETVEERATYGWSDQAINANTKMYFTTTSGGYFTPGASSSYFFAQISAYITYSFGYVLSNGSEVTVHDTNISNYVSSTFAPSGAFKPWVWNKSAFQITASSISLTIY
jgi:hypothetical protein